MGHQSVVFDGKIWVLGGYNKQGTEINDVWYSSDGAHWVQQTEHAPWSPRDLFVALVFKDKLWVIDGSRTGDVWVMEK